MSAFSNKSFTHYRCVEAALPFSAVAQRLQIGSGMPKYFNTEGRCKPDVHYMIKLDDRLARIRKLYVDQGKYFVNFCLMKRSSLRQWSESVVVL